jgi:putative hydrolase of the HAD superfamily
VGRINLLVDYGEVISRPLADDAVAGLAAIAGLPAAELARRYWEHRLPYDAGAPPERYWATVLGRAPRAGELDELIRIDTAGWMHLDAETIAVLRAAHERGARMTLLSNAPHALADAVEALPELDFFDAFVFSARIGVAKPEPAAFLAALDVMGLPAGDVVFIDDREPNVAGARAIGIDGRLFTGAGALREQLL